MSTFRLISFSILLIVTKFLFLLITCNELNDQFNLVDEKTDSSKGSEKAIFPELPLESYPVRLPVLLGSGVFIGSIIFAALYCLYWKFYSSNIPIIEEY